MFACGKSFATQVPVRSPDQQILTENKHGVLTITLNRSEGHNALTPNMYENFSKALRSAATDDTVTMAMITGAGKYFTTGNDLGNWLNPQPGTNSDMSEISELISSLIDFPKPLIGAVNGPAIGIGVTALALMDTVVASDAAYFQTPFTSLGLTAEGCSSYTLPKIMGTSLASDMLLFGRKLTAAEALQCGLVARVIPGAEFSSWVEKWVFDGTTGLINTCYPKSMQFTKHLLRDNRKVQKLHDVTDRETKIFVKQVAGNEFKSALTKLRMKHMSALSFRPQFIGPNLCAPSSTPIPSPPIPSPPIP
ncbi:unnamed protein product [Medioppia subpectinata]|uniref:Enoyl-CoA delta isomerase 2, mitochondrial n=1 Tax=Medioppia subpectinata TaxID=1979941 RepID=A0A7R9KH27_9ACAR|nr:unnamed protein product [Medioppia subpectinata]CAG2102211.1 unnamed protein product [Medioppia subpectinata]